MVHLFILSIYALGYITSLVVFYTCNRRYKPQHFLNTPLDIALILSMFSWLMVISYIVITIAYEIKHSNSFKRLYDIFENKTEE